MKTARELADEFQQATWNCKYGDGDVKELGDRLTAAIEADRRELVEVCAKEADRLVQSAPAVFPVDIIKNGTALMIAARIRALIPKGDSRG